MRQVLRTEMPPRLLDALCNQLWRDALAVARATLTPAQATAANAQQAAQMELGGGGGGGGDYGDEEEPAAAPLQLDRFLKRVLSTWLTAQLAYIANANALSAANLNSDANKQTGAVGNGEAGSRLSFGGDGLVGPESSAVFSDVSFDDGGEADFYNQQAAAAASAASAAVAAEAAAEAAAAAAEQERKEEEQRRRAREQKRRDEEQVYRSVGGWVGA